MATSYPAVKKLRIKVLDLVPQGPASSWWARVMNANMASIMPQVIAAWTEQKGHEVEYLCYTGFEDLLAELRGDYDLVFISSFTRTAQLAYAISNLCRKNGAVTALGGPHARCFPDDARKHFDYVLGLTDKTIVDDVLEDCEQHRPMGLHLSALRQPPSLPSLEERWRFASATLEKAPIIKIVPLIASLGCPYTCRFCIDSTIDFQPVPLAQVAADLKFLLTKIKKPVVGWQDPNFGIRFDELMDAIEEAVPAGSIDYIAESSLSLLTEPRLQRLQRLGFKALLPGIESWYDFGNKSKSARRTGEDKVRQVSEHVNLLLRYVPYVQANFVLGLDCDQGAEPFELTKRFLDNCPAAFPAYSLLTAFGEAAPLNLELQRSGRVLPFPFFFMDNNKSMNVRPLGYEWKEFYDRLIDLSLYSFSWRKIGGRLAAQGAGLAGFMNFVRAVSSEGFGRIKYHRHIRRLLDEDISVQRFFAGETTELPAFYHDMIRNKLGPLWEHLPAGGMEYDPLAYLHKHEAAETIPHVPAAAVA
ncbi:MAG: radical SAM protein [Verrucomicrobiota bacterium]|nr:radical SAM protein [Verrucomicrobiota bacterium]